MRQHLPFEQDVDLHYHHALRRQKRNIASTGMLGDVLPYNFITGRIYNNGAYSTAQKLLRWLKDGYLPQFNIKDGEASFEDQIWTKSIFSDNTELSVESMSEYYFLEAPAKKHEFDYYNIVEFDDNDYSVPTPPISAALQSGNFDEIWLSQGKSAIDYSTDKWMPVLIDSTPITPSYERIGEVRPLIIQDSFDLRYARRWVNYAFTAYNSPGNWTYNYYDDLQRIGHDLNFCPTFDEQAVNVVAAHFIPHPELDYEYDLSWEREYSYSSVSANLRVFIWNNLRTDATVNRGYSSWGGGGHTLDEDTTYNLQYKLASNLKFGITADDIYNSQPEDGYCLSYYSDKETYTATDWVTMGSVTTNSIGKFDNAIVTITNEPPRGARIVLRLDLEDWSFPYYDASVNISLTLRFGPTLINKAVRCAEGIYPGSLDYE